MHICACTHKHTHTCTHLHMYACTHPYTHTVTHMQKHPHARTPTQSKLLVNIVLFIFTGISTEYFSVFLWSVGPKDRDYPVIVADTHG